MRIDTPTFTQHNNALQKEPRFAIAVSFDPANTIIWWFTSHADTALPGGGGTTASVISRISGTSQTLNPDQANATIGNIDFDVVDKSSVLTGLLNAELTLGRSTRQQRVQVYMGYKDDAWADYTLIQTQLVFEIAYKEGAYTIRCQDIQRAMRNDIFVGVTTQMASTLAANTLSVACSGGATTLTLDDTTNFPASGSGIIRDTFANDNDAFTWTGKTPTTLTGCSGVLAHGAGATVCDAVVNVVNTASFASVAHGNSYSDAPNASVGYIKIEDEVCRWVSKTSTTFVLDRRGALNTVAAAHVVDATSTLDTRMSCDEYVYFELPALKAMYALLTGTILASDNMVLRSEDFANGTWGDIGTCTVTSGFASYRGVSLDKLNDNDAANFEGKTQTYAVPNDNTSYTFSIHVLKTSGGTSPTFGVNYGLSGGTGISLNFRLNTDTGVCSGGCVADDLGAVWRLHGVITNNASGNTLLTTSVFPAVSANGVFGDTASTTGDAVCGGVQVNKGSSMLLYAKTTSVALTQGVFPTGWNLGISPTYVRQSDFLDKIDLYDQYDDSQGFIVRFEDLEKSDGKKFIETELALLLGVFMPVYADGSLGCKRMANLLSGAAYVATLDSSNVVSCDELTHDFSSLHNVIQISWNWEPSQKDFTRVNIFLDQPSITVHGQAPTLKLAFRGLHGSRHSAAMLSTRFDMIRDRYTGPPQRINTKVLHRFNSLEVGDVVRHNVRTVRDFVVGGQLDRSMEVQNISIDWVKGNLSLALFGSSRAPTPLPATGDATVISTGWYSSQGTQVVNGTGGLTLSGTNPIHISGTGTLAGNADLSAAGAIYYLLGDVQIDAGAVVNISQNVQLRVMGNLQNNGTINGKGAGLTGAPQRTNPGVFTGQFWIIQQNLGTAGFLGATEAGGGVSNQLNFPHETSVRSAIVRGMNLVMPSFNLGWDGTKLTGVPTDLRGCSGPSGISTGRGGTGWLGGAGGNGGAGLLIVSRGYSAGASGKIDLSGSDGVIGQSNAALFGDTRGYGNNYYAGSGGGGAPGGLAIFLDGASTSATGLTDAGFVALYGKTPQPPGRYGAPVVDDFNFDGGPRSSFFIGTGDGSDPAFPLPNLSGARGGSRVQYVPGSQTLQADPSANLLVSPTSMGLASGTSELLKQSDGTLVVRIKVTWIPPVDARVVGYDLQFKQSSSSVWQDAPPILGQQSALAWIVGARDGVNYDVRIRSAGAERQTSNWVAISGFLVVGKTAPPADVGSLSFNDVMLTWTANTTDDDLAGYIVRYQPSWASTDWNSALPAHQQGFLTETQFDTSAMVGGQVTMLVKCIDTTGNVSVNVSSLQIDLRPPVPTGFSVTRQPDGTRNYAWILASPSSDLDGFEIRYKLGTASGWDVDMTPVHTGLLHATPFESNQLAAGTYDFAIKSVDLAGNYSATAQFATGIVLGDPRIAGSIISAREEPTWTGTKTNCILDGATGWLVANDTTTTWNTLPATWNGWTSWINSPAGSIQYEQLYDAGVVATFIPLVTVVADTAGGGSLTIEEKHSNDNISYSAYATVGPQITARYIKIRITITGTFPKAKSMVVILSATPITEVIQNQASGSLGGSYRIGTGDVRVPITKSYHLIQAVVITLQNVGAGWSVELIDKDTTVGPRIKIYNSSNTLADATFDAYVQGV